MSGIYIPGMEMPKSCYDCPLRKRIGLNIVCPISRKEFAVADVNILFYRLEDCPLIPVPDHGRLIDADDFIKDECNYCDGDCEALPCDCLNCHADCRCDFMLHLLDAPTIIPADPDKEGEE